MGLSLARSFRSTRWPRFRSPAVPRQSLAAAPARPSTSSPSQAPTRFTAALFEYFRDDALGARNFFNTTDQPKNSFTNNQFGGSAGGPIVKDKSFWFVSYEGQRENGGLPQLGTVPTQADITATPQEEPSTGHPEIACNE